MVWFLVRATVPPRTVVGVQRLEVRLEPTELGVRDHRGPIVQDERVPVGDEMAAKPSKIGPKTTSLGGHARPGDACMLGTQYMLGNPPP